LDREIVFESITELIDADPKTERRRFATGSVVSLITHLIIAVLFTVPLLKPDLFIATKNKSGGIPEAGLIELTRVATPTSTPRLTPYSSNRPIGNAMIEREVISHLGRTVAESKSDTSKPTALQPPDVVQQINSPIPGPENAPLSTTEKVFTQTIPPPPQPQKAESRPSINADELDRKIRSSTFTRQGLTGVNQKDMQLDDGAGLDLGNNKIILERRLKSAWNRTRSTHTELQEAGKQPLIIVSFDWLRDGKLVFTGFSKSSGNPTLDNEARNAVQNASPFDPIPKEISLDIIHMNATFY
jgi:TonB family protein